MLRLSDLLALPMAEAPSPLVLMATNEPLYNDVEARDMRASHEMETVEAHAQEGDTLIVCLDRLSAGNPEWPQQALERLWALTRHRNVRVVALMSSRIQARERALAVRGSNRYVEYCDLILSAYRQEDQLRLQMLRNRFGPLCQRDLPLA